MTENENGISVITCSIKPELCSQMLESVRSTIGVNFETIVFDNRENNFGICKVYNDCAKKAKYPYLCFIHEDVIMPTPNWGMNMIEFAEKTPDCGVIGFAGCTMINRNFLGWGYVKNGRCRYYDPDNLNMEQNISDLYFRYNNPKKVEFDKVVALDGLFLFVSKVVWAENPFNEEEMKGFHFYDSEFSFKIAQKWQNYVCLIADIYHFSNGRPDKEYYNCARLFQNKWKQVLPYTVANKMNLSVFINELNCAGLLLTQSIKYGFSLFGSIRHLIKINNIFFFIILCLFLPVFKGIEIKSKLKKILL